MRDAARRPRCTAVELHTISEPSQEAGITRRCTVSSAVSPVGHNLVGSSVAERERVSPQRARFEGAVRVPRIASSVFALSLGGMSGDGEARAAFRALLSTERAGYKLASALVSTLVSYLVGTAKLSDVSELDMSILLTTAEEAWAATHEGEELPIVHRARLTRWIANVPASIAVDERLTKLMSCAPG